MRIREHKIGRLDRRNHSVMELLPELREIKVLVQIPPLERELHTSLRRISIRVSREALHLIQVVQRSLIVIEQRGWRRALFFALSDGAKPAAGRRNLRPLEQDLFPLPLFKQAD